jgi:hypothetical protein
MTTMRAPPPKSAPPPMAGAAASPRLQRRQRQLPRRGSPRGSTRRARRRRRQQQRLHHHVAGASPRPPLAARHLAPHASLVQVSGWRWLVGMRQQQPAWSMNTHTYQCTCRCCLPTPGTDYCVCMDPCMHHHIYQLQQQPCSAGSSLMLYPWASDAWPGSDHVPPAHPTPLPVAAGALQAIVEDAPLAAAAAAAPGRSGPALGDALSEEDAEPAAPAPSTRTGGSRGRAKSAAAAVEQPAGSGPVSGVSAGRAARNRNSAPLAVPVEPALEGNSERATRTRGRRSAV